LLTGLAFPWGTILVNIIGSLVIGFVATLTGPNGRVVVPVEAQAFVMVGLCGGFTTFSAFSLQTFELARDGRLLYAEANIMLSVVLCLSAVALGHWLAALFGRA
jgi:fluoride exporter